MMANGSRRFSIVSTYLITSIISLENTAGPFSLISAANDAKRRLSELQSSDKVRHGLTGQSARGLNLRRAKNEILYLEHS
jgi:hypothetical protein